MKRRDGGETMEENKSAFVSALSYALRNYTRLGIGTMEYISADRTIGGKELVEIRFRNGGIIRVDVTADSCFAIMKDICKALE